MNYYIEFWNELSEKQPDILKLNNIGSLITQENENCAAMFLELSTLQPTNIKIMKVYGYYHKLIGNNETASQKALEKLMINEKMMNSEDIDLDQKRFGSNAASCVFNLSMNYNELGKINNVNTQITPMMGWTKEELVE